MIKGVYMKLYSISENYITYLQKTDSRVLSNHAVKHTRKYLGLKLELNGFKYFLPLSSPDRADYDRYNNPRKTILPIYRMFDHKGRLLGKILINNMIPVPESELEYYDIHKEIDRRYKTLVLKELRIISTNKDTIIGNAEKLYEQKEKNINKGYLNATVEFKALEQACDKFIKQQSINKKYHDLGEEL